MPPTGSGSPTEPIAAAIEAPLDDLGLDLEAVELTSIGKRRVLRVAVDCDGGVGLDAVTDATRAINAVLDDEQSGLMGAGAYTLEVTSRGVDRPLTEPRHWRRNTDRLVKVKAQDGSSFTGRVSSSDEDPDGGVTLDVSGRARRVAYADVAKALVQVEFNRPKSASGSDEAEEESP